VIAGTYWERLTNPHGERFRASWPALCRRLSVARVVVDKHNAPGFAFATFAGDRRALANVERVDAVGLDLDRDVPAWDDLEHRFAACASFLHSTWSSTPEMPRARVFLALSRPVSGDEYRRVYAACIDSLAGLTVDRAASDPSRFWFLPSIPPGGAFRFSVGRGKPVNVDGALALVPPAPVAPPVPAGPRVAGAEDRAAAYLARCAPAISGSGGHRVTFDVAQRLVRGFRLDEETAYRLLCAWNQRCQPPWSERDLRRKLQQAARHGRMAEGVLAERRRAS
jgi:hypothetical protein